VTKNKEIIVHTEDTSASKIRALADDVRTAFNPLLMQQLKQFFDNTTPASLQISKLRTPEAGDVLVTDTLSGVGQATYPETARWLA
jgi:hypothetical protein